MFNIIMTTTQQHCSKSTRGKKYSSRRRKRCPTMIMTLMMTMTILVLTVSSTITSTLAESESNDLNALDTSQQSTVSPVAANNVAANKQTKPETRQYPYIGFMAPPVSLSPSLAGCPLCDSSVYSYCSHKLIHDSCCCDFPGSMVYQIPPQCVYDDCSLLYAKSCYEHELIKTCCCNNPY